MPLGKQLLYFIIIFFFTSVHAEYNKPRPSKKICNNTVMPRQSLDSHNQFQLALQGPAGPISEAGSMLKKRRNIPWQWGRKGSRNSPADPRVREEEGVGAPGSEVDITAVQGGPNTGAVEECEEEGVTESNLFALAVNLFPPGQLCNRNW